MRQRYPRESPPAVQGGKRTKKRIYYLDQYHTPTKIEDSENHIGTNGTGKSGHATGLRSLQLKGP